MPDPLFSAIFSPLFVQLNIIHDSQKCTQEHNPRFYHMECLHIIDFVLVKSIQWATDGISAIDSVIRICVEVSKTISDWKNRKN